MKWSDWLLSMLKSRLNQGGSTLGCPPSQDASHHQDYFIFSRDPYKPSFATVTGSGDNPRSMWSIIVIISDCVDVFVGKHTMHGFLSLSVFRSSPI